MCLFGKNISEGYILNIKSNKNYGYSQCVCNWTKYIYTYMSVPSKSCEEEEEGGRKERVRCKRRGGKEREE